MKVTDEYLKRADAAIKKAKIAQNNKIPKAYKGAVSSFGASLVMGGLIPTLQFFMADSSNRDSESKKIIEAIAFIVYDGSKNADAMKEEALKLIHQREQLNLLKKKIANAAIALKIMMRTYEFSE